jgi:PadR family transcriptional regulator
MGKAGSGELVQGTLPLLILGTLASGPNHGFAVARRIQQVSKEVLRVEEGSLYPALHRLERQKLISAAWKVSENRQRTRVYRLTSAGRRQLTSQRSKWAQFVDAVAGVLARRRTGEA